LNNSSSITDQQFRPDARIRQVLQTAFTELELNFLKTQPAFINCLDAVQEIEDLLLNLDAASLR